MMTPLGGVIAYLLLVSAISLFLMFWDKFCAERGRWRISEGTLLFWALIGGAFGAKLGQRLYRHKTRKEPFRSFLNLAAAWVAFVIVAFAVLAFDGQQRLKPDGFGIDFYHGQTARP